jgi:hypothetical protein
MEEVIKSWWEEYYLSEFEALHLVVCWDLLKAQNELSFQGRMIKLLQGFHRIQYVFEELQKETLVKALRKISVMHIDINEHWCFLMALWREIYANVEQEGLCVCESYIISPLLAI